MSGVIDRRLIGCVGLESQVVYASTRLAWGKLSGSNRGTAERLSQHGRSRADGARNARESTRKTRGSEAHLSAQHQEAGQEPRFQAPDVDARRKSDRPGTQARRAGTGSLPESRADSPVTWRITDRATFEALRRSGRRARCGPVSVVYLNDAGTAHESAMP